jgi:hypothetical protein
VYIVLQTEKKILQKYWPILITKQDCCYLVKAINSPFYLKLLNIKFSSVVFAKWLSLVDENKNTFKPVLRGHLWDKEKVAL